MVGKMPAVPAVHHLTSGGHLPFSSHPSGELLMLRSKSRIARGLMAALALAAATSAAQAQYTVTVLHNNDGESRLTSYTDALSQYGGVARFATLLNETRDFYEAEGHGVVSIFAGDTFLAGAQFQASLDSGAPGARTFYDALAISKIGYDASIIGNHEFDFGPDVLAEFISDAQTHNTTTYLSANLNFAGEAALNTHVINGLIAPTKTVTVATSAGNKTIGIIGATTDTLPFVSSPGAVVVNPIAAAINAQITNLQNANVDHIILAGHLQGISTDNSLVASLNAGIDLIIAGGGDEILRTAGAAAPSTVYAGAPASVVTTGLIPGDNPIVFSGSLAGTPNTYPINSTVVDGGGNNVPIVTTGGNYGYLGRVSLNFDNAGNLVGIDNTSNPQRVASLTADAVNGVAADAVIQSTVVDPVSNFVAGLAANKLAETSVQLLHGGSSTIRSRETNLGNIVADGILHAAQQRAGDYGVDSPTIALVNGGGIRANINAGNVSQLSTFNVSPFGNFVSVVEDVTLADLKLLLENAYSKVTDVQAGPGVTPASSDGRFAHVAGMKVTYMPQGVPGLSFDANGNIITPGNRILELIIGNTQYLKAGQWLVDPTATTVDIATLNFSASGGDQWFRTAIGGNKTYMSQIYSYTSLGLTDQNALQAYIQYMTGGDNTFDINTFKPEYSVAQSFIGGRISVIPEPASIGLIVLSAGLLVGRRRSTR
jgi:5'-nucleotidase